MAFLTTADFRQNRLTRTSRFIKEVEEYLEED